VRWTAACPCRSGSVADGLHCTPGQRHGHPARQSEGPTGRGPGRMMCTSGGIFCIFAVSHAHHPQMMCNERSVFQLFPLSLAHHRSIDCIRCTHTRRRHEFVCIRAHHPQMMCTDGSISAIFAAPAAHHFRRRARTQSRNSLFHFRFRLPKSKIRNRNLQPEIQNCATTLASPGGERPRFSQMVHVTAP
jgi:hypothetical protein